jgi:cytochrome c553
LLLSVLGGIRVGAASLSLVFGLTFASLAWATPQKGNASFDAYKGIELTTLELALPPSTRDLQTNIEKCQVCHQPLGQGFRGAPPVPRLAGQQVEYFVNQLRAFIEHRRVHPIMGNVAQFLSPAMQRALAEHFRGLNPNPIGGAATEIIANGKKIYEEGVSDADVPPCTVCHGPEAKGNGPFPRLAGQLHDYLLDKLENWNQERGQNPAKQDTSAIMQPIAHNLTKAQMEAVAAYLNYLE